MSFATLTSSLGMTPWQGQVGVTDSLDASFSSTCTMIQQRVLCQYFERIGRQPPAFYDLRRQSLALRLLLPQHHEVGGAVFDIGNFGADEGQAAGGIVANPEA